MSPRRLDRLAKVYKLYFKHSMKTKLNWKKKWLDDKSGYWYSAKVPVINWEYIVDTHYNVGVHYGFIGGLYFSKSDDDITRISNKSYKTEEAAMKACEKHLQDTADKFNKWINISYFKNKA